jgi:hypothetical protein
MHVLTPGGCGYEAALYGPGGQLRPRVQVQLCQDPLDMDADGAVSNHQPFGDVVRVHAFRNETGDFALARRE